MAIPIWVYCMYFYLCIGSLKLIYVIFNLTLIAELCAKEDGH